jgi:deoxyribonucleoside regulator
MSPGLVDRERHDRLVEIAWLHHEYGLTQEVISQRYGVSRSTISRALRDAEALGIVEITVTEPMPRAWELSEELSTALGITAHVGAAPPGEPPPPGETVAGRAAARLVEHIASAGRLTIAASWGRTLSSTAHAVRRRRTEGVTVVDAVGHASGGEIASALEVTRTLAEALGANAVHVASPAFVDPASHAFLVSSQPVVRALEMARAADATLTSLGVVGYDSLLVSEGFLDEPAMDRLVEAGAIGEILGQYYDAQGVAVSDPSLVTIGLSLDDLRASARVIAVAAGARKAAALRAAIAGEIVSEIVVDDVLARALLEGVAATA